jgi:hypothetical protein
MMTPPKASLDHRVGVSPPIKPELEVHKAAIGTAESRKGASGEDLLSGGKVESQVSKIAHLS